MYGPVGVAVEILDQFHCTAAEAFEQLCGWRIKPNLGKIQGKAEGILHLAWKILVVPSAGANPEEGPCRS